MDLQTITAEDVAIIAGTVTALVLVSWKFNDYIDAQVESDPLGSYSALYTVLGVSYTLVGALAILGILFGWLAALASIGVVFFCFGVAGLPMILGDIRRGGRRRRDAHYTVDGKTASSLARPILYPEESLDD